ncbi:hypothetical protein LO772_22170 [Yinghuangia sp. ASG 101]|uniref:hypothetical protein n=1 Tax=Yinghuangia sp. ASG 101 TaxID=2896848 RepID=UPI001E415304|nr:hypothetical protein [Yinghuangia sp. ASG 101]UGQ09618.1 hypothetical protein LO772_22170 [Yinghuangia sp. ASG 101]
MVPSESPPRFRDDLSTIYDFMDEILIRCPACEALARVVVHPRRAVMSPFQARRLVCAQCGHTRDKDSGVYSMPSADATHMNDPYFSLPLWLQASTRHGLLWAYNLNHLALIRRFVAAELRGDAWTEEGIRMTLVSRLPAWITSAVNRSEVLRVIARMEASVGGTP